MGEWKWEKSIFSFQPGSGCFSTVFWTWCECGKAGREEIFICEKPVWLLKKCRKGEKWGPRIPILLEEQKIWVKSPYVIYEVNITCARKSFFADLQTERFDSVFRSHYLRFALSLSSSRSRSSWDWAKKNLRSWCANIVFILTVSLDPADILLHLSVKFSYNPRQAHIKELNNKKVISCHIQRKRPKNWTLKRG